MLALGVCTMLELNSIPLTTLSTSIRSPCITPLHVHIATQADNGVGGPARSESCSGVFRP
jgi:hypothetical protein